MSERRYLFSSEAVGAGHPDKVADQVSDAILDAILEQDPNGRVACETLVSTGLCIMAGEITTTAKVDYPAVARQAIAEIGYDDPRFGFGANDAAVMSNLVGQSPDIAQGVNEDDGKHKEQGAGDQGLMFGFATNETPEMLPLPFALSHRMMQIQRELRESKTPGYEWLRPDAKCQVTVEYEGGFPGGKPIRVTTVVCSTQHGPEISHAELEKKVIEGIVKKAIPAELLDDETVYLINPTGAFVVGGPHGDCGLTGRKIISDTYGGMGRHGGGAFSGKDPTKVDRSASYMARYVAKNIVAAGFSPVAEVQLAYAIGVAEPVSVLVDTFGRGTVPDDQLGRAVRETFGLKPKQIIDTLKLRRPIFRKTAQHGHFGHEGDGFTWERTDRVDALKKAVEAGAAATA